MKLQLEVHKTRVIIVTGTRYAEDRHKAKIEEILSEHSVNRLTRTYIGVQGGARGVDKIAKDYFVANNFTSLNFDADWDGLGRSAGYVRNQQMLDFGLKMQKQGAEVVVLGFPAAPSVDSSKGTRGMMDICRKAGLEVIETVLEA